jgi:hypothetical protein
MVMLSTIGTAPLPASQAMRDVSSRWSSFQRPAGAAIILSVPLGSLVWVALIGGALA